MATQQDIDNANQEAMLQYGISEALLAAYPELNYVYELFKSGQKTKAVEELFKTGYYQNTNSVVKARGKMRLEQLPAYQNEVEKYKLTARKRLVNSGVKIDDATFNALAEAGRIHLQKDKKACFEYALNQALLELAEQLK